MSQKSGYILLWPGSLFHPNPPTPRPDVPFRHGSSFGGSSAAMSKARVSACLFAAAAMALARPSIATAPPAPALQNQVTISNVAPRLDTRTGKILELGDGSIAKFGDR